MHQVNIHQAKTQLSKLIQEALNGEQVIIAKDKVPLVRLEVLSKAKPQRRIGSSKGLVKYITEDFNDPLDDFVNYMP